MMHKRYLSGFIGALIAALVIVFNAAPAGAVRPDEVLSDPVLETRARALSSVLRCLVCQNQSIDDSDAELARDLRLLVRERLVTGDSDTEVIDYLVARYGEFVLLKPRFGLKTMLLWLSAPLLLLLGGGYIFFANLRRKVTASQAPGAVPLNAAEEIELKRIMDEGV